MKKISTKLLVFCAILAAMYVALSYVSFGTNDFRISVQSFTVVVSAVMLGPLPAVLVGGVGEFLYQLTYYGLDPTTILWLVPYCMEGLVAGLIAQKKLGNVPKKRLIAAIISGEICLTVFVTAVNGIAGIIQGWGTWVTVLAGVPLRLVITAVRIVIYIIVLPLLYGSLKKVVK